jgi:hypothetical protein
MHALVHPTKLSLAFSINLYFYDMLECALSYRNCVGTVVALWLSFRIILDYPFNSCKPLANIRRSCQIRYRSGGMEATRLLDFYTFNC